MRLEEQDFERLDSCPWCKSNTAKSKHLYFDDMGCEIVRCGCGVVYAKKRINDRGREKFWSDYLSKYHEADQKKNQQRQLMYDIEVKFLTEFIQKGSVLDVGCGKGDFMQRFADMGFKTKGIEYGNEAKKKGEEQGRDIILGELPYTDFDEKFDLIIFRGTIQYFPNPKQYLEKAIHLLKDEGFIYIYFVNTDSICFKLFGKNFSVPVTGTDYIGYNEKVLNDFFINNGFLVVGSRDFYLETPYADPEKDIMTVAKAIYERGGTLIKGPAFFGNILGTLYRRK